MTATLSLIGWFTRDTFRQARASGVSWLALGLTAVAVAACFTTAVTEAPGRTRVEAAFGLVEFERPGPPAPVARTFQVELAGWVADTAGVLLALLWTAGFFPSFLDAGESAVLLTKPVPRAALLVGKFAGVVAFVAAQSALFVGATWLALGLRTGVWEPRYPLALPVLLAQFAVFFSFSALLAVATRSTVASVFGSVAFWVLCWAANLGRHLSLTLTPAHGAPAPGHALEAAYWLLPKPLDFHLLLLDGQPPGDGPGAVVSLPALATRGAWSPGLSVAASLSFGLVLLGLSAYEFLRAEY